MCSDCIISIKCYTQELATIARLLLILQIDKWHLINLWISNAWQFFSTSNHCFCWKSGTILQLQSSTGITDCDFCRFWGLKMIYSRAYMGGIMVFTSVCSCYSSNCPVRLHTSVAVTLFLSPLVSLEGNKSLLKVSKDFQICLSIFLFCGFNLNSSCGKERESGVKRFFEKDIY